MRLRERKDVKLVAMMDVLTMPKKEACVASTGGQSAKDAAMEDVPMVQYKEEFVASMGPRAKHAAMEDVPTMLKKEECVASMGPRVKPVAMKDVPMES